MKKIVTIGGSTSKKSINKILAEYTGSLINNIELIKIDLNDYSMPLFSIDLEIEQGFPKEIIDLNDIIDNADGFVISLAEHNGAYSAAFKNIFDWLSRLEGKVWREKPMFLLSTSPGARGGQSVLDLALSRFPYNGAKIIESMSFPSFNENFRNGEIINTDLKTELLNKINIYIKEI